jgi:Altronate dehydratase
VGFASDLLVRAGATVMFSETTEVRDGIDQLTARAANAEVAQAMIREMAWYDDYLDPRRRRPQRQHHARQQEGRPGQHRRKSHGLDRQIRQQHDFRRAVAGRQAAPEGFDLCRHAGQRFCCGTLQLAAGMNLHVFTTGRGTPYGLAAVPVIKVATRNDLARRWHDLMDVNAGRIASGEASIEEVGWELFHLMLDVASGRKQTWAEHHKLHNALTLFNPAPIT